MSNLNKLKGKMVIVTGSSGYIGSALVDELVKHSCKVTRVSREELKPLANTKTIKADIRAANSWIEIVSQADIIYHLAGNTSVFEAAKNPAESLNSTLLPLNHLFRAVQEEKCKPRVVFASTATVYGLTPQRTVAETFEPAPITVYDLHKLFAERQLAFATQLGILDGVSLRLSNVYGPSTSESSSPDRGILNRVTAMALQGKNLAIYGDGNYLRDYVYISDVVNAFLIAGNSQHLGGQSFNIASGIGTTLKNVFTLLSEQVNLVSNQQIAIDYIPWPENVSPIELREFIANIDKFSTATGWKPLINLEQGISRLLLEYKKIHLR